MADWSLYDELLSGVPEGIQTQKIVVGTGFAAVQSESGAVGLGSYGWSRYYTRPFTHPGDLSPLTLRELAELIKSWNPLEAAVGQAALNAWYNAPQTARQNGVGMDQDPREDRMNDPFIMSQKEIRGKKVVTIGHFPYLEKLFEPICELAIIEREPDINGDYPFEAADYLLPDCDYAYLNASGLTDKSLPRMLALSQNAKKITLVGPCATLWPGFARYGVQDVSGLVITDAARALRMAAGAEHCKPFAAGRKVALRLPPEGE